MRDVPDLTESERQGLFEVLCQEKGPESAYVDLRNIRGFSNRQRAILKHKMFGEIDARWAVRALEDLHDLSPRERKRLENIVSAAKVQSLD